MVSLLRALDRASLAFAILCVAAIMVIISVDAVSRYALKATIPWAFELLTYYLMVSAICFAVSPTFSHGDHICIDLFQPMMSEAARRWSGVVYSLLAGIALTLVAYSSGEVSVEAWHNREFLPGYIIWPAWLSHFPVALGSALMAARLWLLTWILLIHGRDPEVARQAEGEA